jgi:hypothetical protein
MTKIAVTGLVAVALLGPGGGCGSAHNNDHSGDAVKASYDSDDNPILNYGHAAGAADARAITALVQRYYAAAAAQDGATACALTRTIVAETLPEDYGQPPGPVYLQGASTCPALLSIVFKHFHAKLTVPVEVTGVRVSGDRADALVDFKTLQAGVIKVRREHGAWKIDGLLAVALP